MNSILIHERCGTDISNRQCAAVLRAEILRVVTDSGTQIQIDLIGVRTISDSFADELFGILARDLGSVAFREKIHLVNVSDVSRETIIEAIRHRLAGCPA